MPPLPKQPVAPTSHRQQQPGRSWRGGRRGAHTPGVPAPLPAPWHPSSTGQPQGYAPEPQIYGGTQAAQGYAAQQAQYAAQYTAMQQYTARQYAGQGYALPPQPQYNQAAAAYAPAAPRSGRSRYKTKLCSYYTGEKSDPAHATPGGTPCPHGPECQFAHGWEDLRLPSEAGVPSQPAPPALVLLFKAEAARRAAIGRPVSSLEDPMTLLDPNCDFSRAPRPAPALGGITGINLPDGSLYNNIAHQAEQAPAPLPLPQARPPSYSPSYGRPGDGLWGPLSVAGGQRSVVGSIFSLEL
jgi:hypothetical protein